MLNELYCADFVDFAKGMIDQVDLTITSPPYGDQKIGHREYNGFTFDVNKMADALFDVTKDGGVCVWVVGDITVDGFKFGLPNMHCDAFMDLGWNLHDTMIFEKSGLPNPPKNKYYQSWDYMYIFSKGKPKTFHALKDKPNTNAGKPAHWGKITARQKDGSLKEAGKNYITPEFGTRTNIWRYITGSAGMTSDKIAYEHPAIFPEMLVRDHILTWTNVGDIVLDPMVGSGTTSKVARLMQRQYIGVDSSKKYIADAKIRTAIDHVNMYLPLTADEFNSSMVVKKDD
jgi:DNA modification methylase